jgi:hypothetical protein
MDGITARIETLDTAKQDILWICAIHCRSNRVDEMVKSTRSPLRCRGFHR